MSLQGNQNGVALKDPAIRQKAYNLFCEHLALGKSVKSWYYEDELGNMCCWETMVSYIEKYPIEFQPIKRKVAETKGYQRWEAIAEASATGENEKANTASLQMVMRNKFGWDKKEEPTVDAQVASSMDSFIKLVSDSREANKERSKSKRDASS